MNRILSTIMLLCLSLLVLPTSAQTFVDISDDLGIDAPITYSIMGAGMSFYDFNKDGWDDLTYCQTDVPPVFYQNNGGTFTEVDFGIIGDGEIKHLTWVDFDNDGDADIFYTMKDGPCRLFENDGAFNFTDISAGGGFPDNDTHHVNGCSWGDYDKDGLLDVYLCHFNDQFYPTQYTNWLMKNNGDGTFTNVTETAGCGNGHSRTFQASFFDYNNDNWPDIYVINDRFLYPNALYKNNGDGTFEDVSTITNTGVIIDAMSSSPADYDNDEDLDLYMTNSVPGNILLNNNDGVFADSTAATDLFVYGVCWAANWVDFENDGKQDVYVCTMDNGDLESYNFAAKNVGLGAFPQVGFLSFPDDEFQSWSSVSGDINNDGYTDLANSVKITQHTPVWLNEATAGNNYIKIGLEGTASNKDAIGSWIKVYTTDVVQTRYTYCGEDYLCQDSQREIIGVGLAQVIDSISVLWPSGFEEWFYDVDANQTLNISEGETMLAMVEVDGPTELCAGETVNFSAPAGYDYLWSTGATTQNIAVTESTDVSVTITNEYGVSAVSDLISVNVIPVLTWYPDNDNDGYGDENSPISDCLEPVDHILIGGDCDDDNPDVYPDAPPQGNDVDNNCDGEISTQESSCPADFNNDLIVNAEDLLIFLSQIGCSSNCFGDLDGNDEVNTADLLFFLVAFANACP